MKRDKIKHDGIGKLPDWAIELPLEVRDAVNVLIDHGVESAKLRPLLVKYKPGPKRSPKKEKRKSGRPRSYRPEDYEVLKELRRLGERRLRSEGKTGRIGDATALAAAGRHYIPALIRTRRELGIARAIESPGGNSYQAVTNERKLSQWARAEAKRLSEGRKIVRK